MFLASLFPQGKAPAVRRHPHLPELVLSGGDGRPHHLLAEQGSGDLHSGLNYGGESRQVEVETVSVSK